MTGFWRETWACFHVPLNDEGAKEMEYLDYIDTPSPNIKEFAILESESDLLWPLYDAFNKAFDIIIDTAEDETMRKEDVPKALEMAIAFKAQCSDEKTREVASKLIEILQFANEHHQMVEFWF